MFLKIKEWLFRYLPAEIFAILGVFIGGTLANLIFHNQVTTALAATLGENIGFYGKILYKDTRDRRKKDEYLDLLIRPSAVYFATHPLGNVSIGLFLGKLFADLTFYTPAIIFYELRKKVFTD